MLLCSLKSSKKRLMTLESIGRLTLERRAMAWLMPMISSREKCFSTPAEISSPMHSISTAACSIELSERVGSGAFGFGCASTLGGVEVSFIATYPVLDHFGDPFGVVLGQHLQMLDLPLEAGVGRRQADLRQRVQFAEHIGAGQLDAG